MSTAVASPEAALARFDRTERVVHWVTATLGIVLMLTGAAMYAGPLSTLVGRRGLVRTVHVVSGFALIVPLVVALLARRRGAALRADLRELNRFDGDDRRWLHRKQRRDARSAKFNAGQKLNAAFLAAAGLVMLGTGAIMHWPQHFAVDLRTGSTFVHDWFALGVWIAVTGHVLFALRDPMARHGMWHGTVSATWARTTHPRWYERMTGRPAERLARPGSRAAPSASAPAAWVSDFSRSRGSTPGGAG